MLAGNVASIKDLTEAREQILGISCDTQIHTKFVLTMAIILTKHTDCQHEPPSIHLPTHLIPQLHFISWLIILLLSKSKSTT